MIIRDHFYHTRARRPLLLLFGIRQLYCRVKMMEIIEDICSQSNNDEMPELQMATEIVSHLQT
jgi:hypothetical protein